MKTPLMILFLGTSLLSLPLANAAGPCKELKKRIRSQCEAAGYVKGGPEGKRLGKDCVRKIKAGEPVEGVTAVTDEERAACKAKIASMKESK